MSTENPTSAGCTGTGPTSVEVARPSHLRDAVAAVTTDPDVRSRYPDGVTGGDVLSEIRAKYGPDAWPLVSVLDVIDELRELYR